MGYDGDPEAALVSFASHAQASAAYRCSEPLFNNRFIKIFWHNPDKSSSAGGGQSITQVIFFFWTLVHVRFDALNTETRARIIWFLETGDMKMKFNQNIE